MPTTSPRPARPSRSDAVATSPDAAEVVVLRWPEDSDLRTHHLERGAACLLVVPGDPPPLGEREDWIAADLPAAVLAERVAGLRRRVGAERSHPVLDDDGLLRVGDRWVSVSDGQLPVVELLVRRFRTVVTTAEIAAVYGAGGAGLRTLNTRIRKRVATVGLALHPIRDRGVVLDWLP